MNSTFAIPVHAAGLRNTSANLVAARKRKRNGEYAAGSGSEGQAEGSKDSSFPDTQSTEYTAVVTPTERSQRRLAGVPIDQSPPPPPFPHADVQSRVRVGEQEKFGHPKIEDDRFSPRSGSSLHPRHLSAMTTLLHRCLMAKDYNRASRAIGLILRSEMNGKAIDIRDAGLWGMGAEILFRQHDGPKDSYNPTPAGVSQITRSGFERAKLYYERLIVQYPLHKTWPDAVNALDFSIALFNLWVYVTNQESLRMQEIASSESATDPPSAELEVTVQDVQNWELEQATQIAEAMDVRMQDITFSGNTALIRLRAMVALWVADLLETSSNSMEAERLQQSYEEEDMVDLSDQIERITIDRHRSYRPQLRTTEIRENRSLAASLLEKLQNLQEGGT